MSIPNDELPVLVEKGRRTLTKAQAHAKLRIGTEFRISYFNGTRLARVTRFDRDGLPVVETRNAVDGKWTRKIRSVEPADIRFAFGNKWRTR